MLTQEAYDEIHEVVMEAKKALPGEFVGFHPDDWDTIEDFIEDTRKRIAEAKAKQNTED